MSWPPLDTNGLVAHVRCHECGHGFSPAQWKHRYVTTDQRIVHEACSRLLPFQHREEEASEE